MATFAEGFDQIQPVLLRRLSGGWLAVSRPGSILSIGVAAESPERGGRSVQDGTDGVAGAVDGL